MVLNRCAKRLQKEAVVRAKTCLVPYSLSKVTVEEVEKHFAEYVLGLQPPNSYSRWDILSDIA